MNKKNGIAIVGLANTNDSLARLMLANRDKLSLLIVLGDMLNKELNIKTPEINLRDLLPRVDKRRKIK